MDSRQLVILGYSGFFWTKLARNENVPVERPSPFGKKSRRLERIVYIMGVIDHHYELITGWLVLKAFFSFMQREEG